MQGLLRCSNDVVHLGLSPAPTSPSPPAPTNNSSSTLSIDVAESAETRIRRLISEHPVIIFSQNSCCMCHVMKKLLANIGVHPTVIELDNHEIAALPYDDQQQQQQSCNTPPAVFIGGTCVGGLESLVALHVSGHLVPKLVQVGALCNHPSSEGSSYSRAFSVVHGEVFAELRTSIASDPRPTTSI